MKCVVKDEWIWFYTEDGTLMGIEWVEKWIDVQVNVAHRYQKEYLENFIRNNKEFYW